MGDYSISFPRIRPRSIRTVMAVARMRVIAARIYRVGNICGVKWAEANQHFHFRLNSVVKERQATSFLVASCWLVVLGLLFLVCRLLCCLDHRNQSLRSWLVNEYVMGKVCV